MQFKQKYRFIVLGCMILLSGVVLLTSVPAQKPERAQIAFYSDRDGNGEIYVMDADGNSPCNLTNSPAKDAYPAWSPDGKMIAFTSNRDGNWEIYVMDAVVITNATSRTILQRTIGQPGHLTAK